MIHADREAGPLLYGFLTILTQKSDIYMKSDSQQRALCEEQAERYRMIKVYQILKEH